MTPQDRIRFFWASGILPGTMFDDLDYPATRQLVQPPRRRLSWLQRLSLGRLK
jgi:hypothetical protein